MSFHFAVKINTIDEVIKKNVCAKKLKNSVYHFKPVVAGEGTVDDGEGAIDEGEGDIDEGDGGYIVGIVSGGYIDGEGGYIEGEGGYAVSLRHITSMDPGAKQYCCPVGSSILIVSILIKMNLIQLLSTSHIHSPWSNHTC